MAKAADETDEVVQLAEEVISVTKRTVETGRVQVELTTETTDATTDVELSSEHIVVERVPFGHVVTERPVVREVDGVIIVPIVEEILVKQLVLREEVHLRRIVRLTRSSETQPLRRQVATITRMPPRS